MASKFSLKVFKYRSYTPIPFIILMVLYNEPNVYSLLGGFLMAALGELIRLWGVSWAGSETRTTGGVGGTYLVISGPFGHVRNPLYVGNIMMYVGIGIMANALCPYLPIIAFLFFAWQYVTIVGEEEAYLKTAFGESYAEYCKNVPRFIPRISAYKNSALPQPPYNLKAGLRSERRTLQAFTIITVTVFLLWLFRIMPMKLIAN
jgi:protein-S-isoprenylcysteine O-methyltransferase Ste14